MSHRLDRLQHSPTAASQKSQVNHHLLWHRNVRLQHNKLIYPDYDLLYPGWWFSDPLQNMSQLGWWHSQYMESHEIHVPVTTNQYLIISPLYHHVLLLDSGFLRWFFHPENLQVGLVISEAKMTTFFHHPAIGKAHFQTSPLRNSYDIFRQRLFHINYPLMWVKQCHKPSLSHHHFYRCYKRLNHS